MSYSVTNVLGLDIFPDPVIIKCSGVYNDAGEECVLRAFLTPYVLGSSSSYSGGDGNIMLAGTGLQLYMDLVYPGEAGINAGLLSADDYLRVEITPYSSSTESMIYGYCTSITDSAINDAGFKLDGEFVLESSSTFKLLWIPTPLLNEKYLIPTLKRKVIVSRGDLGNYTVDCSKGYNHPSGDIAGYYTSGSFGFSIKLVAKSTSGKSTVLASSSLNLYIQCNMLKRWYTTFSNSSIKYTIKSGEKIPSDLWTTLGNYISLTTGQRSNNVNGNRVRDLIYNLNSSQLEKLLPTTAGWEEYSTIASWGGNTGNYYPKNYSSTTKNLDADWNNPSIDTPANISVTVTTPNFTIPTGHSGDGIWHYNTLKYNKNTLYKIPYSDINWVNNSSVTFTSEYVPIIYSILYDSNKGSGSTTPTGSTSSQTNIKYTDKINLRNNGFSRVGYTFYKWWYNDTYYDLGAEVSALTETAGGVVTMKAIWNPIQYTITFNKDGGSEGTNSVNVNFDSKPQAKIDIPSKIGYRFDGYYSDTSWATQWYDRYGNYQLGNYTTDNSITLYAKWTRQYAVSVRLKDGTWKHVDNVYVYTNNSGSKVEINKFTNIKRRNADGSWSVINLIPK